MDYRELLKEENSAVAERYELAMDRIASIVDETSVPEPYREYFQKTAEFILYIKELRELLDSDAFAQFTLEELAEQNRTLYKDILPENYRTSYADPVYACRQLGEEYGKLLSFLYTEIRGMIVYAYECRMTDITILCELFIEIYNCFEEEIIPKGREIRKILYWFVSDYSDVTLQYRVREQVDPELRFATDIIM